MASARLPVYKRLGDVLTNRNFITVRELAVLLGVSDSYIRRLAREKKIPGKKKGRDWVITSDKVFTARRLAEILGLSHSHIRHLMNKGVIKECVKIGRDWVVSDLEIDPDKIYQRRRRKKKKPNTKVNKESY
jgi:excisionase family DNA binding protein